MTWTQPICRSCWNDQHPENAVPVDRPELGEVEVCAWCGRETSSGIYVRVDPRTVPYPRPDDA